MKLALCLFKYFPYGGLQRNFFTICQELIHRGHKVIVYTGSWEGEPLQDLQIEILPRKGLTNHGKNRCFSHALQQALTQNPVDLVVGFNKMPDLDIYYCADTCFATRAYEEKSFLYRMTARSFWSLKYERAVFDTASSTEVLLLSAKEGDAFKKYYQTAHKRLHLMPPGINKSRVKTAASNEAGQTIRKELGINKSKKVIAFLGSDYKRKGLDRLFLAVAALPNEQKENTTVLVIGRDKHMANYKKLADTIGLTENIIFAGQRDDVPDLLFASDCLVHPAYLENTGNVLLEAIVAGLPVICTATCGYAFYIKENNLGFVTPEPFTQEVINKQLEELLPNCKDWTSRCTEFTATADIYSRPLRAAEKIEAIGAQRCL